MECQKMISTHDTPLLDRCDVWARLSAPLPAGVIAWRQDGKPMTRDGHTLARFVAYIEANTVRERLDAIVPGEWDLTLDLLPPLAVAAEDGDGAACSFKARLQVLGVIREDVGTGRDYKQAATDAFKRAAVRFGIGHELYALEPNWVPMDGVGRSARPIEDPQLVYTRRYQATPTDASETSEARPRRGQPAAVGLEAMDRSSATAGASAALDDDIPTCPKCGGRMWDNRLTKRNPRAPDFRCRDRSCDGVVWPQRSASGPAAGAEVVRVVTTPLAADEIPF
jgi:hypothetical protein